MRRVISLSIFAMLLSLTSPASAQVNIGFGGVAFDEDQPIEVTADGLTVDETSGEAVFSGNVIVSQGGLRMASEVVRVLYTNDDQRDVREVVATGGVLITRGNDAAEGNRARYVVATGTLQLFDNVLVIQGGTAIAGDSMVVDMETGDGVVEGRVRTTLSGGN